MNSLKLIGILLLAILISPDTLAHCKGKHAENPPPGHCDGGGGGTDEAIFHVDIDGVFTTFDPLGQNSRPQSIKNGSKTVIFSPRQDNPMEFMMTDFWSDPGRYAGGSDGANCFGHLIDQDVNGSLHLNEFEGSQISIAVFWFNALNDDPLDTVTEIKYVLEFHDDEPYVGWFPDPSGIFSYEFPPVNATMKLNPTSWEMRTEGKGELKKGPCVGSGIFDDDSYVEFSIYRLP